MNAISSSNGLDARDVKDPARISPPPAEPAGGSASPGAGRDSSGRFTAGNKSGRGNPFARRTARLRSILLEAVTDEDMQVIAQKLLEQARAGDLAAMKLLLGYVIGKPIPCAEPDRLDLDEWHMAQEAPAVRELNELARNHYPADLGCLLAGLVLAGNEERAFAAPATKQGVPAADAASRKGLHPAPAGAVSRTAAPSANGRNGHAPPSANGRNGHVTPSPNGRNGHAGPSANGQNGHAE